MNPDLVVRDKEGKPYSVRYDQVNAMFLNEFLKEHRKVEQQRKDFEAALARQQKQIEALTAGLQKVSAQLELKKPAPQTRSERIGKSSLTISAKPVGVGGCVSAVDFERKNNRDQPHKT